MCVVEDQFAVKWLRWWVRGAPLSEPVFPSGYAALSRGFKRLLSLLGLPQFTLGSLRAGGATESFRQHRNLG
eukprot:6894029-Heterocapsa_arctica.AAC.1